jgi:signal transduction histidine kinase
MRQSSSGAEVRSSSGADHAVRGDRPAAVASGRGEPTGGAMEVTAGLSAHLERSPVGLAIADGASLQLRFTNPAFDQLCDVPSPERSNLLTHVLPVALLDAVVRLLDALPLTASGRREAEVRSGRGDAGVTDWKVTVSRVPSQASPGDVVVEIQDISAKQREQRELAQVIDQLREVNGRLLSASLRESELARKAEAASEAKSTFLATMSHELRTPLTAILGYEELIAEGIFGAVTDLQRAHLGRMKNSANHLLALIDQILTLSRVEADREPIQVGDVVVDELLEWTTSVADPLTKANGLTFQTACGCDGVMLRTDGLKVRQILLNLVGNAVKFTDRGGVTLTARSLDEHLLFEVRDTGIGIAEGNVERVFDAFWQVEQRPSRKIGGSGLGLNVSRRLARLLGGDITARSTPGEGSVFTVTLPREYAVEPR